MEAARKGGYGQDTGSVDPSQAKCELHVGISIDIDKSYFDKIPHTLKEKIHIFTNQYLSPM